MKTPHDLPQDLMQCHEIIRKLIAELGKVHQLNEKLEHRLEQLLRAKYGPRSEKIDENQLLLFAKEILEQTGEEKKEAPPEEEPVPPKKRKGHGRKPRPDLPRERVEHDLPEEEKTCSCCGGMRVRIGEEVSEQLEFVPAVVKILEHVRFKYACPKCEEGVTTAPKPSQPIEKGLPGPGLLAQVVVSKFADHLPLHRQQQMFERYGLDLSRSTLCDWMKKAADLLAILFKKMKRETLFSAVLHTDDTPVQVQDREKRRKTRQGRAWVYVGDPQHPYTIFDYTPDRSRDGPAQFLGKYKGYLQADAYPGYDRLYASGDIIEVACWAHARRKFKEAITTDPERGHLALAYIAQLYSVERLAAEEKRDAEGRRALRQEKSVPVLKSLNHWLLAQEQGVLPKSPIGEAVGYALNHWKALCHYTENGILSIDNNRAEQAIRPIALGRKNWLFFGSDNGGRTASILLSFVQTCKDLGKNPFAYLRDVFSRLPDHPHTRHEELLPDRWTQPSPPSNTNPIS